MKVWATFLLLIINSTLAGAEGVGYIRSSLQSMESYKSVKPNGYDLRVDIDSNGVTDIQSIRDGNEEVILANNQFQINSYNADQVRVVSGVIVNGSPQVNSIEEGKINSSIKSVVSDSEYDAICKSVNDSTGRLEKACSELSIGTLSYKMDSYFADECLELEDGTEVYSKDLIRLVKLDKERTNGALKCITSKANESFELYRQGKIDRDQMLKSQLILAKAKSDIADFYEGRASIPLISCSEGPKSGASLSDNGKILITAGPDGKTPDIKASMLQRWGISESPGEFAKNCKTPKVVNKEIASIRKDKNEGIGSSLATMPAMEGTVKKFAPAQVAAINKDLAQTKVTIPSPTEASPKALAKIEATQGQAAVQQVMQKQSSGILNMTNAVMAAVNTHAVAGTKSPARAVASTSGSGSGPRLTAKKSSVSGLKATTIGKNEKVVEEYLVDESSTGAKTRAVANVRAPGTRSAASIAAATAGGGGTRNPANVDEAKGGSSELAGGTGGGGSTSSGGAGRGSSFSPSSGGTPNSGKANAAAASAGQARGPASATSDEVSGDELVSFIKNSEYASTKLKIQKDNKFRNQLKVNGITIIDKAGNFIVPGNNKVIFMDKGNRFEKQ